MRLQQSAIILQSFYRKVISPWKNYAFEIAKVRKFKIKRNKNIYLNNAKYKPLTCKLHKNLHTDFVKALTDPCLDEPM